MASNVSRACKREIQFDTRENTQPCEADGIVVKQEEKTCEHFCSSEKCYKLLFCGLILDLRCSLFIEWKSYNFIRLESPHLYGRVCQKLWCERFHRKWSHSFGRQIIVISLYNTNRFIEACVIAWLLAYLFHLSIWLTGWTYATHVIWYSKRLRVGTTNVLSGIFGGTRVCSGMSATTKGQSILVWPVVRDKLLKWKFPRRTNGCDIRIRRLLSTQNVS